MMICTCKVIVVAVAITTSKEADVSSCSLTLEEDRCI